MSADSEFLDLSSMNPTGRFSDRAADYVKYRPDYPESAIDSVLEGLGDPGGIVVADVGAGTGISARLFADRGARVIAVEPNAAMREAATPHARIVWWNGTAETTGLPAASIDVVACFQAFHWFRPAESLAEFHRVLRPGGRLALVWNVRDESDALTRGYGEAIHTVVGVHPSELHELDLDLFEASGCFSRPELTTFPHSQRLDAAGLLGRATSSSYVPRDLEAVERLGRLLGELYTRHRDATDCVSLRYVTDVYRARPV